MSARGSGYYLVVITAVGCGYCEQLKQTLPQTKRALQASFPGIVILEIQQPRVTTQYTQGPSNLNKWGMWFPLVMLVPKSEWDGGVIRTASVFNGTWNPTTGRVDNTGRQAMNQASLTAFVSGRV
jgi:hypothetical protein